MTDSTSTHSTPEDLELLSFRVGEQEYSIDIMLVREIRGWTRATPLPHSEPFVRGVINLRGSVLPIIDLAARLGIEKQEATERNVIIVVQISNNAIGLLVDAVSDIITISHSELQSPPDCIGDPNNAFVRALTVIEGRMLRIIDLEAVYPTLEGNAA